MARNNTAALVNRMLNREQLLEALRGLRRQCPDTENGRAIAAYLDKTLSAPVTQPRSSAGLSYDVRICADALRQIGVQVEGVA